MRALALAFAALLFGGGCAAAQASRGAPLLPGGDSHAPVNVSADRLEYFSKEQKAVYTGHVFARQGDGSLRASTLTISFVDAAPNRATGRQAAVGGPAGSRVTRMVATGPVTIVQKGQVGVGDNATYERAENRLVLVGNVSLTQGPDVVKGDKLVYDLTTGQAQVVGRVTSLFIPDDSGPSGAGSGRTERARARRGSAEDAHF